MFTGGCSCLFTAKQLKMEIFWIRSPILAMSFWMSSVQFKAGELTVAWHLLGTTREWPVIPPWRTTTVMCSLWCGGRDFPSPSHHSSWDAAGYVDRKCSAWPHLYHTHDSTWILLKVEGEKKWEDFLQVHTYSVQVFSEHAPSSLQMYLISPKPHGGELKVLPSQAREGARGWCLVLPLVLSGKEQICPMEKPKVCIQNSSTAGSTSKGPGQGDQGWKIAS